MRFGKQPPLAESLSRSVSWDCPGLWSGEQTVRYERVLTASGAAMRVALGGAPPAKTETMAGDFSALLTALRAPRAAHAEKAPPRAPGASRAAAPPAGAREWRMSGVRQSAYEIDAKPPQPLRRFERFDWRWASGPWGEMPGGARDEWPVAGEAASDAAADGPLVLDAPLAAWLLHRVSLVEGARDALLRPQVSSMAFDDEGLPPALDGFAARRTPLEPWPRRLPGGLTWKFTRPAVSLDGLPAAYIARSFTMLEVEEGEFQWALPYFNLQGGKPRTAAGIHLLSGRLEELTEMIKAFGTEHAGWGLAPHCDSPALILRPLSKLKGRRIPFTPQPASDFVLQAAREFIQGLL